MNGDDGNPEQLRRKFPHARPTPKELLQVFRACGLRLGV